MIRTLVFLVAIACAFLVGATAQWFYHWPFSGEPHRAQPWLRPLPRLTCKAVSRQKSNLYYCWSETDDQDR